MARTLRNDPAAAWHHVMNRGARHQPIYLDDRDRYGFLELLDDLHREDGIETHAYCLMGNHYHLILFCPDGNLSDGMHHLGSRHAQQFNRRHDFDGPLFRGRFLSKPIETDEYLLQASRYVHRNPLDLDTTTDLAHYPWSSYPAYLGHRRPQRWLHRSMVLGLMGGDSSSYRSYVVSEEPADEPGLEPDPVTAVEATVAAVTDRVTSSALTGRGRRTIERNLALVLSVEGGLATPSALANYFGLGSATTVRSAVRRTLARAQADHDLAVLLERCRATLPGTSPTVTDTPGA